MKDHKNSKVDKLLLRKHYNNYGYENGNLTNKYQMKKEIEIIIRNHKTKNNT